MNKIYIVTKSFLIFIFSLLWFSRGYACISSLIPSQESGFVYLRALQFPFQVNSKIIAIPRNYKFIGANTDHGLMWNSKYAVIGANVLDLDFVVDGVNEAGLAGGMLYFSGYNHYQTTDFQNDSNNSLAGYQLLTWILTNFASVEEVVNNINNIAITDTAIAKLNFSLPVHYIIYDNKGKSIVLEFAQSKLKVYHNPLYTLTDAPAFNFHLINFNQYLGINNGIGDSFVIGGERFASIGNGGNSVGLPGGNDSISRFVRMAFMTLTMSTVDAMPKNQQTAVLTAFKMLANFDLPTGVVKTNINRIYYDNSVDLDFYDFEITQWQAVADLKNSSYYIKTYNDNAIKTLSFKDFDLTNKNITYYPLISSEQFQKLQLPNSSTHWFSKKKSK